MLMPLDMLRAGEWAEVEEVTGQPGWVGRLAELGIRQGCRLQVVQPGSPCLLQRRRVQAVPAARRVFADPRPPRRRTGGG